MGCYHLDQVWGWCLCSGPARIKRTGSDLGCPNGGSGAIDPRLGCPDGGSGAIDPRITYTRYVILDGINEAE